MKVPTLRVARSTDYVDMLLPFHHARLGLYILYRFDHHDGFEGIMHVQKDAPYHFEFTKLQSHKVGRSSSADNLLVFCMPNEMIGQTPSRIWKRPTLRRTII